MMKIKRALALVACCHCLIGIELNAAVITVPCSIEGIQEVGAYPGSPPTTNVFGFAMVGSRFLYSAITEYTIVTLDLSNISLTELVDSVNFSWNGGNVVGSISGFSFGALHVPINMASYPPTASVSGATELNSSFQSSLGTNLKLYLTASPGGRYEGGTIEVSINTETVPEPSTNALLVLGAVALVIVRPTLQRRTASQKAIGSKD